jgi:ATP-dependent Lon protease
VLIPKDNERNLNEVPMRVMKMLSIELVEHMDEVLEKALVLSKDQTLFSELPLESVSPEIAATVNNVPH